MQSDCLAHDAIGLAELVRTRQASARELIDIAISRTEAVNPAINAIVLKDYDAARQRASRDDEKRASGETSADSTGAQRASPRACHVLIDSLAAAVAGLRMAMGSRHYRHFVPAQDAPVVTLAKAAGLNIFGKSGTPRTRPDALYGARTVRRVPQSVESGPYARRVERWRSGGRCRGYRARPLAPRMRRTAAGSIRIPASCCGLFGLKPSRGRVPRAAPPGAGDLGIDHAVSRSVRDSALLLDLLAGNAEVRPARRVLFFGASRGPCKPLNIAYVTDAMLAPSLSVDSLAALEDAAQLASSLGHNIEPVSLGIDFAAVRHPFLTLWSVTAEDLVLNAERISRTQTAARRIRNLDMGDGACRPQTR